MVQRFYLARRFCKQPKGEVFCDLNGCIIHSGEVEYHQTRTAGF